MSALLSVESLEVAYGRIRAVQGVSVALAEGEAVAMVGRNGAGKTSSLRAIMGLAQGGASGRASGVVRFEGRDLARTLPHARARAGLGYVPEHRGVLPSLSVAEQLTLAQAHARPGVWDRARALRLFPRLAERLGHAGDALSGGEQQMLAVARALIANPRVLLLDEPTEGLAPAIASELVEALRAARVEGCALLLVDGRLAVAARLTTRAVALVKGAVAWEGPTATLVADTEAARRLLGLG